MTAQELLRTDATVRTHFALWHSTAQPEVEVETTIACLGPGFWRAFCRSGEGLACAAATGMVWSDYRVGVSTPAGATKKEPAVAQFPTRDPQEALRRCTECNAHADALSTANGSFERTGLCTQCRLRQPLGNSALKTKPFEPIDIPSTPVPMAPITPLEIMPTSDPLMDMIASKLNAMGYRPQEAITAQQCTSIAESAALQVAELVLEQIRAEGIASKQTIDVTSHDTVVRTITGKTPAWFPTLVKLAQCHIPALLVGPAGCGKTTAAKMLADAMGLPFMRISIAAGTDEGQLQGWLLPKEQGNFRYVYSPVSRAYESEEGGVVLIDDMDLGDANALGILNAALDNGGWYIPLRDENPLFIRSDSYYIMGAANTWGHGADRKFVGANQLDERTLSRFRMGQIACDYDESLETDLYDAGMVQFGHRLRTRCRAVQGFKRDVSTRDIESAHIKVSTLDAHGKGVFTHDEAWYAYFADWQQDELSRVYCSLNDHASTAVLE